MANNPQYSDTTVIAGAAARYALLNGGTINFYTGAQPTDANTAIGAQLLLATLTFGSPAFGTPVASGSPGARTVATTANAITGANAIATGTCAWARCLESGGSTVMDMSVGTASADCIVNTTSFVSGIPVAVGSCVITSPEN